MKIKLKKLSLKNLKIQFILIQNKLYLKKLNFSLNLYKKNLNNGLVLINEYESLFQKAQELISYIRKLEELVQKNNVKSFFYILNIFNEKKLLFQKEEKIFLINCIKEKI